MSVKPNPFLEFQRGELEPETPYYFRLSAKNSNGEGVLSDINHFMTLSGGHF